MNQITDAYMRQVKTWQWSQTEHAKLLGQGYRGDGDTEYDRDVVEIGVMQSIAERAPTFYLDPEIGDAVWAASQSVPLETELSLTDAPEPQGFVWSERPLKIPYYHMDENFLQRAHIQHILHARADLAAHGFAWSVMQGKSRYQGETVHGVMLYMLSPSEELGKIANKPMRWPGIALMQYSIFWRFGDSIATWLHRAQTQYENTQYDRDWYVDDHSTLRLQFAYAFWRFIQQDILERRRTYVQRAAARQAKRLNWEGEPLVDVVTLRKRRTDSKNLTPEELREEHEWSCWWVVRGHWRNQFYAKEGVHKTIWIEPYDKGDHSKPFKAKGHRTYAVVR